MELKKLARLKCVSRKPNKDNNFHTSVTSRHCMGSMMYVEISNQKMKIEIVSCGVCKGD